MFGTLLIHQTAKIFKFSFKSSKSKRERTTEMTKYDLVSMATRFNISMSFRKKLIFSKKKAQTGPF